MEKSPRLNNIITMAKKILIITLVLSYLIPLQTQAAGLVPCGGEGEEPCQLCHIFIMANNVLGQLFTWVVPTIAVLMLVIGGVMLLFAGARPNMLAQAKGVITSVVIGLLIIFAAWVIVNTILNTSGIVDSPSILQWYEISCSSD